MRAAAGEKTVRETRFAVRGSRRRPKPYSARFARPRSREIWLRQGWTQPAPGTGPCCDCGGLGRDGLVLRFRGGYPAALEGRVDRSEWARFKAELDAATAKRDPCVGKCCAIAIFAVLFYTTIIGIFFYMGAEAICNSRRAKRGRLAVAETLERWNTAWTPRGLRVAGRWHADRSEDLDEPFDEGGEGGDGVFPLICITLLGPPAGAASPASYPVYYGGGFQQAAFSGLGGAAAAQPPPQGAASVLAAATGRAPTATLGGASIPVAEVVGWGSPPPASAPPKDVETATAAEEDPA